MKNVLEEFMKMKDISWDIFTETGRIDAYLIHKNIEKRGETRNAGHKGYRNNYKADRIR